MFAYCSSNPVNFSDPTGYKQKFWYILFEEHQPGYIHTRVQLHILAVYNTTEGLYRKEFAIPGIGRVDIIKPSTGEAWEIKYGGSTVERSIERIDEALNQLSKYTVDSTGLHPGSAGAFTGFFTINCESNSYGVFYMTPEAGVILYYLLPLESVKKADFVFAPSTVQESSANALWLLALCPLPKGITSASGGGDPFAKKAFAY